MELDIIQEEDICMVYLKGDLNFSAVSKFEREMKTLFQNLDEDDAGYPPPVLVDLSAVDFLDSAGIAALVGVHLDSRHRMVELGYCGFGERVESTLRRTHVDQLLNAFKTEREGREGLIDRQRVYQRYSLKSVGTLVAGGGDVAGGGGGEGGGGEIGGNVCDVKCLNISKGGCSLFSRTPFATDSGELHLTLEAVDLDAPVRVRRVSPMSDGYELACAFIDPDPELKSKLLGLIQKLHDLRHAEA